jgi:hypothetical protein
VGTLVALLVEVLRSVLVGLMVVDALSGFHRPGTAGGGGIDGGCSEQE